MARGRQFYEPIVEENQQASPMRGFQVGITGTYVLLDDVVTALREYAQSLDDPASGGLVHEVANWLHSGAEPIPVEDEDVPESATTPVELPAAVEADPNVDRVEIYPDDPESPRPRWIARSCDSTGKILFVTNGSFDQAYVIRDAEERWPGKSIHLIAEYSHDTVWEENDPGGLRSTATKRRRPSPNRLWR